MTTVTHEEHLFFLNQRKEKTKGKKVQKSITPAMRHRVRTLLKTRYSVAIRQRLFGGAFKANPFDAVEWSIEVQKKVEYFSPEELENFFTATRHTFAAHYLMEGGSLWDLSKILGHSSTEVTERRYGHFDLEHVRARMRVVEGKDKILRPRFGVGGVRGVLKK